MEVATILTIVVLNILLPTADVYTDINLAVKLYRALPDCFNYAKEISDYHDIHQNNETLKGIYDECDEDPVTLCSHDNNTTLPSVR